MEGFGEMLVILLFALDRSAPTILDSSRQHVCVRSPWVALGYAVCAKRFGVGASASEQLPRRLRQKRAHASIAGLGDVAAESSLLSPRKMSGFRYIAIAP